MILDYNKTKHQIALANGKKFEAALNGNNFIIEGDVVSQFTNESVNGIRIDKNVVENADLIDVRLEDGKTWVIIGEKTADQIKAEKDEQWKASIEDVIADVVGNL